MCLARLSSVTILGRVLEGNEKAGDTVLSGGLRGPIEVRGRHVADDVIAADGQGLDGVRLAMATVSSA